MTDWLYLAYSTELRLSETAASERLALTSFPWRGAKPPAGGRECLISGGDCGRGNAARQVDSDMFDRATYRFEASDLTADRQVTLPGRGASSLPPRVLRGG